MNEQQKAEGELPGMLAVAQGVTEQKWPHTTDAQVWAKEFVSVMNRNPVIQIDEDFMRGWFATAILAGMDTAARLCATEAEDLKGRQAELEKSIDRVQKRAVVAENALAEEKRKNLLDRKLILFLNAVQTWLNGACAQHLITPCRAAEIQLQAACVPPSVLGAASVPPTKPDDPMGSLAWQACDFCNTYHDTNSWPAWTVANGPKAEA